MPALAVRPSARTQSGFLALDTVNVREVIAVRACVMKVPPAFFRGAYKSVMRLAIQDCEWHGDPESVADLKRVEVVSLASENFVIPSCTRWQSAQEPAS